MATGFQESHTGVYFGSDDSNRLSHYCWHIRGLSKNNILYWSRRESTMIWFAWQMYYSCDGPSRNVSRCASVSLARYL